MLFSSMIFLWIFLPVIILIYYIVPVKWKNAVLLLASLFFYFWGETTYILLLLISVTFNFVCGWILEKHRNAVWMFVCIMVNIGLLGYFKYFNLALRVVNKISGRELLALREILLPLGISFYTFQILSYVIDVYRGEIKAQRSYGKLLLYVSFFPQLIAGPIVKYKDVENQIGLRVHSRDKLTYGIRRFIYGLGKKVLISNTLAYYADMILDSEPSALSSGVAWLGAVLYTFQIYFDFSGYSDMAIGLGKIFGFNFQENFRYPYCSQSIQEFWRRWHISLSTWFREYVYIPLGGNRKGKLRTYINLAIVFFLTGLWHGADFNFIFWGLYHGGFLILERLFVGKILEKNPFKLLNHIYTMTVVVVGWVFFRLGLKDAAKYVIQMIRGASGMFRIENTITVKMVLIGVIGILTCGLLQSIFPKWRETLFDEKYLSWIEMIYLFAILFLCITMLVSDTYNPFIYFRF